MVYRMVLFVWEFVLDLVAVIRMGENEKDLEILLLRQQLRILERKQARGPQIPRWQKVPLAVLAVRLKERAQQGRVALEARVRLFKPDTVIGWHRAIVQRKWTYRQGQKPGRPPLDAELEHWILLVARENPGLGYEKLVGELRKLGFKVSKTAVSTVLQAHGMPPAPERKRRGSSWRVFLNHYKPQFLACDFFHRGDFGTANVVHPIFYRTWNPTSASGGLHGASDRGMGDAAGAADDLGSAGP